jgi:hypothetical protein
MPADSGEAGVGANIIDLRSFFWAGVEYRKPRAVPITVCLRLRSCGYRFALAKW